ncbi:hypothetical protein H072_6775 [Dactylellina haptotyla CBS 200.50]|uniref:F-box domain-containing protein n=1 Tax=Dactylellina haptotyla (strain CBS 200.50) TaxID=1284197 RepID=S8A8U7_DACHA|nr:hypothetical protein H072_6775 [Dactylellina haptotyla CBS 200.50]
MERPKPSIVDIPSEILSEITRYLDPRDVKCFSTASRKLQNTLGRSNQHIWWQLLKRGIPILKHQTECDRAHFYPEVDYWSQVTDILTSKEYGCFDCLGTFDCLDTFDCLGIEYSHYLYDFVISGVFYRTYCVNCLRKHMWFPSIARLDEIAEQFEEEISYRSGAYLYRNTIAFHSRHIFIQEWPDVDTSQIQAYAIARDVAKDRGIYPVDFSQNHPADCYRDIVSTDPHFMKVQYPCRDLIGVSNPWIHYNDARKAIETQVSLENRAEDSRFLIKWNIHHANKDKERPTEEAGPKRSIWEPKGAVIHRLLKCLTDIYRAKYQWFHTFRPANRFRRYMERIVLQVLDQDPRDFDFDDGDDDDDDPNSFLNKMPVAHRIYIIADDLRGRLTPRNKFDSSPEEQEIVDACTELLRVHLGDPGEAVGDFYNVRNGAMLYDWLEVETKIKIAKTPGGVSVWMNPNDDPTCQFCGFVAKRLGNPEEEGLEESWNNNEKLAWHIFRKHSKRFGESWDCTIPA